MIRYQVTRAALEERINVAVPGWLARAASRTSKFEAAGRYDENSSIWGEVKPIYMQLQHNKCAYCERVLEGGGHGKVEHDLEHYRPKANVQCWPTERMRMHYDFATGAAKPGGYYLLSYEILNYATACKSCNSSLKWDFFPIAGDRAPDLADRQVLAAELPFLIYPISDIDDDPEAIFTFGGIIPVPRDDDEHRKKRARVTIDFFRLDSREHLRRERAQQITMVCMALTIRDSNDIAQRDKDFANQVLASALAPDAPHCGCVKAFWDIYAQDAEKARELARSASGYLVKKRE